MKSEIDPKRYLGGASTQGGKPLEQKPVMQHPSKEPQPVLGFDKVVFIDIGQGAWKRIFDIKNKEE